MNQYKNIKNPPYLTSYPRSGSHFFVKLFYEKTGFILSPSHNIINVFDNNKNKVKNFITIIRDPQDSIHSHLAMQKYYKMNINNQTIENELSNYVLFYNFLNQHADYIIDFNDLVNSPDSTVNSVINLLNINESGPYFYGACLPETNLKYLPSSKTVSNYKKISLDRYNIGLCYYEYNQAIEKKIKIKK